MLKWSNVPPFIHYNNLSLKHSTLERFTLIQFFHVATFHSASLFSLLFITQTVPFKLISLSFYACSPPPHSLFPYLRKMKTSLHEDQSPPFLDVCCSCVKFSLHVPDFPSLSSSLSPPPLRYIPCHISQIALFCFFFFCFFFTCANTVLSYGPFYHIDNNRVFYPLQQVLGNVHPVSPPGRGYGQYLWGVAKIYTSIPYPHQFKQLVLLPDTISGLSLVVDSITATTHSYFISGFTLPIHIRILRVSLYVGDCVTFTPRKLLLPVKPPPLFANLTSTWPYFQPPLINVAIVLTVRKHFSISSLDIVSIWFEVIACVQYTTVLLLLSSTFLSEVSALLHLPLFFPHISHILQLQSIECSLFPNSTPVLFPLQQPLRIYM